MKKFLIIITFIFFNTQVFADKSSPYSAAGITLGESALKHVKSSKLFKEKKSFELNNTKLASYIIPRKGAGPFGPHQVEIFFRDNDPNYKIISMIHRMPMKFEACKILAEGVLKSYKERFPNQILKKTNSHSLKKNPKYSDSIYLIQTDKDKMSPFISLNCINYNPEMEKKGFKDEFKRVFDSIAYQKIQGIY